MRIYVSDDTRRIIDSLAQRKGLSPEDLVDAMVRTTQPSSETGSSPMQPQVPKRPDRP